jgi:hypothetical protein
MHAHDYNSVILSVRIGIIMQRIVLLCKHANCILHTVVSSILLVK